MTSRWYLWMFAVLGLTLAAVGMGRVSLWAVEPVPAKQAAPPKPANAEPPCCGKAPVKAEVADSLCACPMYCFLETTDEDGTLLHYHYAIAYNNCEFAYIAMMILDQEKFAMNCCDTEAGCEMFSFAPSVRNGVAADKKLKVMARKKQGKVIKKDKMVIKKKTVGMGMPKDLAQKVGEFFVKVPLFNQDREATILVRQYWVDPKVFKPGTVRPATLQVVGVESEADMGDLVITGATNIVEGDGEVSFTIGGIDVTSSLVTP